MAGTCRDGKGVARKGPITRDRAWRNWKVAQFRFRIFYSHIAEPPRCPKLTAWRKYGSAPSLIPEFPPSQWGLFGKKPPQFSQTRGLPPKRCGVCLQETYNVNLRKQVKPRPLSLYFRHKYRLYKFNGRSNQSRPVKVKFGREGAISVISAPHPHPSQIGIPKQQMLFQDQFEEYPACYFALWSGENMLQKQNDCYPLKQPGAAFGIILTNHCRVMNQHK